MAQYVLVEYMKKKQSKYLNDWLNEIDTLPSEQKENLLEFISFTGKLISNEDQKKTLDQITEAKKLAEYAEEDLKSATQNYENKSFRKSLVDIAEAVEKTVKAYCLATGLIEASDLKSKISHETPRAFVEMAQKKVVQPIIYIFKKKFPDMKTNIKEFETTIKDKKIDYATASDKNVAQLLKICIKINDSFLGKEKTLNKEISEFINSCKDELSEAEYNKLKIFEKRFSIKLCSSFVILFLLSVLAYPHFDLGRYPNKKPVQIERYEDLGIVKNEKKLLELVKYTIDSIKESSFFENPEKNQK